MAGAIRRAAVAAACHAAHAAVACALHARAGNRACGACAQRASSVVIIQAAAVPSARRRGTRCQQLLNAVRHRGVQGRRQAAAAICRQQQPSGAAWHVQQARLRFSQQAGVRVTPAIRTATAAAATATATTATAACGRR